MLTNYIFFPNKVTFGGPRRIGSFDETPFNPIKDQFIRVLESNAGKCRLRPRNDHEGFVRRRMAGSNRKIPPVQSDWLHVISRSLQLLVPSCFIQEFS